MDSLQEIYESGETFSMQEGFVQASYLFVHVISTFGVCLGHAVGP